MNNKRIIKSLLILMSLSSVISCSGNNDISHTPSSNTPSVEPSPTEITPSIMDTPSNTASTPTEITPSEITPSLTISPTPSFSEHVHAFSSIWSYDETHHYHVCECGEYSDYEEHDYYDYIVDQEATDESEGLRHRFCKVCGYKQEEIIPQIEYPIDENALEMPLFYINTENQSEITSKEEYIRGELSITNAKKYNAENLPLSIRGRGNYSWSGTEKKSYRIKFDEKYNPLNSGKGKAKSWTLLAVHCDKSLLRTDAAFYFASKLNHLPFVSSSSFVELYLNNKYQGVYELCDQIQVNKNRVDIDEEGFLVELDKNASEDVVYTSLESFEVKSDKVDEEHLSIIEDYLEQCEDAIIAQNKDKIEEIIDIPSSIDAYLVEELFKNLDVGWGSFYYVKPQNDKLYFGPVWDFDLSSGNADADDGSSKFTSYQYTYVGNPYFKNYMQQHTWYTYLRKNDWYNDLIKERWLEIKDYALETIDHINETKDMYLNSFKRNFTKWRIFSKKINREPSTVMGIKTFEGQVTYLTTWLNNRITWLDKYYQGLVQDC